ncbi:WD repeat-containing protein 87-like isoform X1 [Vespa crabro]|uniref:WD repeat-containing protein 87-like isoform X1 n=1 Tax=Vespa crabro TaxID=7445 RepID=UPI001F0001EA|nr:WD repeat-containing protein 87-like isoform X1 [Vespa crabro]XP_046836318.1 WD repeat-containing protein 87-like isoform X1 [Vespa crabro]
MDSQEQHSSDFINVNHKSNSLSKNDFESLGFVIDNGKPRFKLDEPVSTNFLPNIELTKSEDSLDDSDTLSFVILGKKSLDSIQASSLATYSDIQQKCMSIDYNSIISSLNSSEIQQKLAELLQENVKLKETLKQNTVAMKQQFNTLVTWQEEVMNVHKNHKQKFKETRQLINVLKQENAELKLKLCVVNIDDTMVGNTKEFSNSTHLNQLQNKISSLTDELCNFKSNCAKLSEDVEKYISLPSMTNMQLKETNYSTEEQNLKAKELEEQDLKINEPEEQNLKRNEPEEQNLEKNKPEIGGNTDQVQVKEISQLNNSLKDEIKSLHCSINLNMTQISDHISPQSHYFTQSIKQYGEMLQEMTDCFIAQIARYSTIQKYIKECINILDACETIKLPEHCDTVEENWSLQLEQLQIYKDKLSIYQKTLNEEQLKLIIDRQSFIKIQNQFQKVFSDYNSILYELQIISEENIRLNILKDSISKESSQKITELEKHKNENEQKFNDIKAILEQERETWSEQKKLFDNLRKTLNMEYKRLIDQKEMLFSLHQEKALVDKQCQLYKSNEELLQTEKETLEQKCKQLIVDADTLRIQLEEKENALIQLGLIKKELDKELMQQKNEIELLKIQISYNEEDFNSEKKAKEELLLERNQLQKELENAYKKTKHSYYGDLE